MTPIFIFDLDATITRVETLPLIARSFGIAEPIDQQTAQAVLGTVAYADSLIDRVASLRHCPVDEVSTLLAKTPCFERIVGFIRTNSKHCAIATSNLDVWIDRLGAQMRCPIHCSTAQVENDCLMGIQTILQKESVVRDYRAAGHSVVFIGDGANDAAAMREADIAIAFGAAHAPAADALAVSDFAVYCQSALCSLLDHLKGSPTAPALDEQWVFAPDPQLPTARDPRNDTIFVRNKAYLNPP